MHSGIRWYSHVSFSSGEVFIDKVQYVGDTPCYILDDGSLGDSLGVGAITYPTKEAAIEAAKRRIHVKMNSLLDLCK